MKAGHRANVALNKDDCYKYLFAQHLCAVKRDNLVQFEGNKIPLSSVKLSEEQLSAIYHYNIFNWLACVNSHIFFTLERTSITPCLQFDA